MAPLVMALASRCGLGVSVVLDDDIEILVIATLLTDQDVDAPSAREPELEACFAQGLRNLQDVTEAHRRLEW